MMDGRVEVITILVGVFKNLNNYQPFSGISSGPIII
jgi:hypothetical protein